MSERDTRWRLILGESADNEITSSDGQPLQLSKLDAARDKALADLYDGEGRQRRGGLGASSPKVARWLGDIRTYFPSTVVRVMQQDAMERLGLRHLLLEPEMLDQLEPDISLVTTLVGLNGAIPEESKDSARKVVKKVTDELQKKLASSTKQSLTGALNRAARTRRPRRLADIDWSRTLAANLGNYQPDYKTIIPEKLVGYARQSTQVTKDVILCIDQSGSMAESIVYSSVFSAVMASLPSLKTRLVVFDTEVVDLTEEIDDPVDVLFGVQLGGGTDINGAIAYCQTHIRKPSETIFVLISDLYEGGVEDEMLRRVRTMVDSGVTVVALLALSDSGSPSFDADLAAKLCELGAPSFACTPDVFPDMMAAAIEKRDLATWAANSDIVLAGQSD